MGTTRGSSLDRGAIGLREVLVFLACLYLRHPERLPEMKRVFTDDLPVQPIPSRGTA